MIQLALDTFKEFEKGKVRLSRRISFGTFCAFLKLNSKWGIKLYRSKAQRNFCFRQQHLASKHGLGPFIEAKFEIPLDKFPELKRFFVGEEFISQRANFIYGYFTRVAILLGFNNRFSGRKFVYSEEVLSSLGEDLRKLGIDFFDNGCGNFGYFNKRLVCIDFGPESIELNKGNG